MKLKLFIAAAILLFKMNCAINCFAQDTLRIMEYNVMNYGDGCQGSNTYLHSKLKTIVSYANPDLLGMVKANEIKLSSSDNPPGSESHLGFADSILAYALNAAYPNKYAYCTLTDASEHTANFDQDMNILFYNKSKLGFVSVITLVKDTEDFDLYKLYYKDPNLSATHDTTYLYTVLNHTASDGQDPSAPAGRNKQDSAVIKKLKTIFYHLPNLIHMGDFNTHTSTEAGYELLTQTADTSFKFYDPPFSPDHHLTYPKAWDAGDITTCTAYLNTTTRYSSTVPNSCGSSGGAKDWFNHILVSPWIVNNYDYVKYVPNSYITIGNDGHRLSISENDSTHIKNTSAPSNVINAIFYLSDKYPVMAKLAITYNTTGIGPANPLLSVNTITVQPTNTTVCAFGNTSFSVRVSGLGVNYQWQLNSGSGFNNVANNGVYSGATLPNLIISGASTSMNGFSYRCVITSDSVLTSNTATLTVNSILSVTLIADSVNCGSSNGSISSSVSGGTPAYTYLWNPGAQTTASVSGLSAATYTLKVTDAAGCTQSGVATVFASADVLNASAGANGSISPSGSTSVNCGGSQIYSITPNSCYYIADVLVDGVSIGAVSSYTFSNVTASHTISASFAATVYAVIASAGVNGSISPSGNTSVNCGSAQVYSIAPNLCYYISDVLVDGVSVGAVSSYTFSNVTVTHIISASFSQNVYTLSASSDINGSVSPNGNTSVNCGGSPIYSITANPCYYIANVLVDGVSVGSVSSYTFSNVTSAHTISASFSVNAYTVTALAGSNGIISPTGNTIVNCGSNQVYSIAANSGFHIDNVMVDGDSMGIISTYKFNNVSANHTILASFSLGAPVCPTDINNDGITNNVDFLLFLSKFNTTCTCTEDINKDGFVDNTDFLILLSQFNHICY